MIVSRTYILLHTSNSITCILHTELEVQPRLEVCWALDIHTERHSSRKLLANTIKTRKSFVKRKIPLLYFTNVDVRLRKATKLHTLNWGEFGKDGSPIFATLDNVLQSVNFGLSFSFLDFKLCGIFTLQQRSRRSLLAEALAEHLQDKLLPHLPYRAPAPGKLRS